MALLSTIHPTVELVLDNAAGISVGIGGILLGWLKARKAVEVTKAEVAASSAATASHEAYEQVIQTLRGEITRLANYCEQLEVEIRELRYEIQVLRDSYGSPKDTSTS